MKNEFLAFFLVELGVSRKEVWFIGFNSSNGLPRTNALPEII